MTTSTTAAMAVLKGMYAAETEYLAAGGPGGASFALLAPYFAADVVLHQADALPYGGVWRGHDGRELAFPVRQTITVAGGCITEVRPFYWDTAAIAATCGA